MCQGGMSQGPSRMRLRHRNFVVAVCCVLALQELACARVPRTDPGIDRDRPNVHVSRHELRIVFPRDTARRWGWSGPPEPGYYVPRYTWQMGIDAIEGPRDIRFDVTDASFPREFRSLRDLLSTARGQICSYGMMTICGKTRMTGTVEHGRTVLTLRDSALISWLFALRPTTVSLSRDRRETNESFAWDSVPIEYVVPSVRPLDSATRAAALYARRRESLARYSVRRRIWGGRGTSDHVSLIVGDSLPLLLLEVARLEDLTLNGQRDLTDSGWTVLDPRIAQLLKPSPGMESARETASGGTDVVVAGFGPPRMYIKALRPGSTTIRVRGVHGRDDAVFDSSLPSGVLESEVVVTRPPHRLEITPRPDTLRVGQNLLARVRVYDATGEFSERVPVQLVCTGCTDSYYDGTHPSHIWSNEPGGMTIVARLNGLADTLSVVVVDSVASMKR